MNALLRAGGVSAIIGGVLRAAGSFAGGVLPAAQLPLLYFATDVFLLLGVAGFWLKQRASLGVAGTLGLAIFVMGILFIRVSAAIGAEGYQLGAIIALLGLTVYAVKTLIARSGAVWAPTAWLVALAAGIAGAAGVQPAAMTALAGVAFGAGFVAAGVETLRR